MGSSFSVFLHSFFLPSLLINLFLLGAKVGNINILHNIKRINVLVCIVKKSAPIKRGTFIYNVRDGMVSVYSPASNRFTFPFETGISAVVPAGTDRVIQILPPFRFRKTCIFP